MKEMNRNCIMSLVACVALLGTAVQADDLAAHADITFTGSSTLHDFEGRVSSKPFTAVFAEDQQTGKMTVTARTTVSVRDITTDNGKRDKNMYTMFDLDHFKLIEGALLNAAVAENAVTHAMLHLKIRNVEQDIEAALSNLKRAGDSFTCTMTFPVSLADFNLKAPSVLGVIRVDDVVQVECTVTGKITDPAEGE